MNRAQLSLCLGAFDRATHSPIGRAYESASNLRFSGPDAPPGLSHIRQKLLDGEYASLSEYFTELEETVHSLVRFWGPESELSLALFTIHQMIVGNSRGFSDTTSNYKTALATLTQSIKDFSKRAPNTRDKFREFGRAIPHRERSDDRTGPQKPNTSHIDVHQLKLMIQRLNCDEDERELVSLVHRYEPHFAHATGVFEVDLKKLHPETLIRVWNFIIKRVPIPGKESPMKRIASAPSIASGPGRLRVLDSQKALFRATGLPETSPFLANLSPARSPTPSPTPVAPKTAFLRDRLPILGQLSPVLPAKTGASPASPRVTIQTEPVAVKKEPEPAQKAEPAAPQAPAEQTTTSQK